MPGTALINVDLTTKIDKMPDEGKNNQDSNTYTAAIEIMLSDLV